MDAPAYLAKEGKVSGPFVPSQIEEMKRTGEFYKFEWMWDGHSPDWSPVPRSMAPPKLPDELPKAPKQITRIAVDQNAPSSSAKTSTGITKTAATGNKVFCAVLFDSRTTLGGEVTQAHAKGGKFISTPSHHVPVSRGGQATVDLLDEATDRSTKVQTSIMGVSRMGDRWVVDLEWTNCPLID
jgi:hypothetical protein